MTLSPLQFAKEWEQLKGRIASAPAHDVKLLLIFEFWPILKERISDISYRAYFDELRSILIPLASQNTLEEMLPGELDQLISILLTLSADTDDTEIPAILRLAHSAAARISFYVGDIQNGLKHAAVECGQTPPDIRFESLEQLTDIEALRGLIEQIAPANQSLAEHLKTYLDNWELERAASSNDSIYSLLVETNGESNLARGRLKRLHGQVEFHGSRAKSDKVSFYNSIVSPEDPLVGCAYDSIEAVRNILARQSIRSHDRQAIHADFRILDTDQSLTGSSLGLSFALVTFTQLLRSEVHRVERFNSLEVAVTGVVDKDGSLVPVSEDSISLKVQRAFFSHVRYIVVPHANLKAAGSALESFRSRYPRRQIFLIGAKSLSDLVADLNIIRAEKVCIGEFIGKQIVKYSRMTKVQIPLLLILGYLLACLIQPRISPWFDWNPYMLKAEKSEVSAVNIDGDLLWKYSFPGNVDFHSDNWTIADLNGDGDNEVLILPGLVGSAYNESSCKLFVFKQSGDTLFTRNSLMLEGYPIGLGSSGDSIQTEGACLYVRKYRGETIIITCIAASNPARGFIKFWSTGGESLGEYTNSGYAFCTSFEDYDGDGIEEAIFKGTNNRLKCATLFALDPIEAKGVSPPYILDVTDNDTLDLRFVVRGTQKFMLFFPPSRLIKYYGTHPYQTEDKFRSMPDGSLQFWLNEGSHDRPREIIYVLSRSFRVLSVEAADNFELGYSLAMAEGISLPPTIEALEDLICDRVTYYIDGEYITEGQLRAAESRLGQNSQN